METKKVIKYGCLGCLLVYGVLALIYFGSSFFMMVSDSEKNRPFEVQTDEGIVTLHLGMPKDSVILLLGEPNDKDACSIGNTINETLKYYYSNDTQIYDFEFENGKLESFSQNSY